MVPEEFPANFNENPAPVLDAGFEIVNEMLNYINSIFVITTLCPQIIKPFDLIVAHEVESGEIVTVEAEADGETESW